jgi:hypothetical protein
LRATFTTFSMVSPAPFTTNVILNISYFNYN